MTPSIPILEYLPSLAIAMARLYPCFFLVPAFCFQHVRGMPRHAIVFSLALIPAPGIYHNLPALDYSMLALCGLLLKEAVLGFLLGMLLSMPFWLFESVGALLDNQRGALIAGQLNPLLAVALSAPDRENKLDAMKPLMTGIDNTKTCNCGL